MVLITDPIKLSIQFSKFKPNVKKFSNYIIEKAFFIFCIN